MAPEFREFNFSDGFRFGLGFVIAGCLVWIALAIILAIVLVAVV